MCDDPTRKQNNVAACKHANDAVCKETNVTPETICIGHMESAITTQRAACLDLVGEKAFNELYALLKSNQVDEASMTDLSRLVFKIIPYDKSEVIQMMYKLLCLESQLEGR